MILQNLCLLEMSRVDIAYIVSHGFAVRMVIQTDLLGKLVKKGFKVACISPDRDDKYLLNYCHEKGVSHYPCDKVNEKWAYRYSEARKYLLEDIDSNTALKEKYIHRTRYSDSVTIKQKWITRLLYLVYKLNKVFPWIRKWYRKKESSMLESESTLELVKKINPRLLISTYPVNFNEAVILRAGNRLDDTTTVIHLLSWDNITCKGHFPELADKYIAWGEVMRDEFMSYYGIKEDDISMCGVPHFDIHFDEQIKSQVSTYLKELNIDIDKPYILFAMSSPRFAPGEIRIVELLAEWIQQSKDIQLIIRPHPQNVAGNLADENWLPRLQALDKLDGVAVFYPEFNDLEQSELSMKHIDLHKLAAVLSHASICINSGSTVGIDALLNDVPVIISSFDGDEDYGYWLSARRLIDFPHLQKYRSLNNVYVAHDMKSLVSYIKKVIQAGPISDNDINKQVAVRGKATEAVIDTLISHVEERKMILVHG